jgi:hypothetical protein
MGNNIYNKKIIIYEIDNIYNLVKQQKIDEATKLLQTINKKYNENLLFRFFAIYPINIIQKIDIEEKCIMLVNLMDKINLNKLDKLMGWTLLHYSTIYNMELLSIKLLDLLDYSIIVKTDYNNSTAFHYASKKQMKKFINIMMTKVEKDFLNIKDYDGLTGYDYIKIL